MQPGRLFEPLVVHLDYAWIHWQIQIELCPSWLCRTNDKLRESEKKSKELKKCTLKLVKWDIAVFLGDVQMYWLAQKVGFERFSLDNIFQKYLIWSKIENIFMKSIHWTFELNHTYKRSSNFWKLKFHHYKVKSNSPLLTIRNWQ